MAAAQAAEIPERSLTVAADALGVRTQRGQWLAAGVRLPARLAENSALGLPTFRQAPCLCLPFCAEPVLRNTRLCASG